MTSTTTVPATPSLPVVKVCPNEKPLVTVCKHCGQEFPYVLNKKTCSNACRQAAYRESPAHKAILERDKDWRKKRRNAWTKEKVAYKSIGPFLITMSGPDNDNLPRLGDYWIDSEGKRMNLETSTKGKP